MTPEQLRRKKREAGLTNAELAERTGIPISTIAKVLSGVTKNPRKDTLKAIGEVLGIEMDPDDFETDTYGTNTPYGYHQNWSQVNVLRDKGYVYGSSARKLHKHTSQNNQVIEKYHTLSDYLALPDDRRVELIDGKFYDLAAPTGLHQIIALECWKQIDRCIDEHGMPCRVMAAPFDVLLDSDQYTVVQPDVMIFCKHPEYVLEARAPKAPDFVIEVLSPSTRMKDIFLKTFKYQNAGVQEYWLVDPDKKTVTTHVFGQNENDRESDTLTSVYTFAHQVPVHLSEGKCTIDFSAIEKKLH